MFKTKDFFLYNSPGYRFCKILTFLKQKAPSETPNPIFKQVDDDHTENKAKIKMYCGKLYSALTD